MAIVTLDPPLPSRSRKAPPTLIVLHATAGATARSSIDHLRSVGLSYHRIIARDGKDTSKSENADGTEPTVFACVSLDRVAFHVGSTIPIPVTGATINNGSVGISMANIQRSTSPEPYTSAQIIMLDTLVAQVKAVIPTITQITAHAFVQPWNRSDPLLVDIDAIGARHGLSVWRPSAAEIKAHTPKKTPGG